MSGQEHLASDQSFVCADCRNVFLQPPKCTTCGAEKLYDATVRSLQEDLARFRSSAMSEQQSSTELCHAHEIKEVPRYGIPGTIWSKQDCPYCKIDHLQQDLARFRSSHQVMLNENDRLRMAERNNVQVVAEMQKERDELQRALRYWLPDETLIPKGHEAAWNEHVQLIPEHRITTANHDSHSYDANGSPVDEA